MSCPDCGGIVAILEGCELCINCGWSPCCSASAFEADQDVFSGDYSRIHNGD